MRTAKPGSVVTMRLVVTDADAAIVDDQVVHHVYGTAAMIRHVEQLSRYIFANGLDEGQEGMGKAISLEHHSPVPVGAEVELSATVTESTATTLVTETAITYEGSAAATAVFTQVVVGDAVMSGAMSEGMSDDSSAGDMSSDEIS